MNQNKPINLELVNIALEKVAGTPFEKFVNAFYPSIAGEGFIPLGGHHDGGADAFQADISWEGSKSGTFYQASIEQDHRSKIKKTIERLKAFGRDPRRLIYLTSRSIPHIDIEETELSDEFGVEIRIRERSFIASHVNDSVGTRAAYSTYLEPTLAFLAKIGATSMVQPSENVASPAVYVFLRQELERHEGKEGLVNALADGMILWALEDTDPELDKLMSEKQVIQKIESTVPPAAKMLKSAIPKRLEKLSEVSKSHGRAIRRYKKRGLYCLAHEFRERVAADNASDEALRIDVRNSFVRRLAAATDFDISADLIEIAAQMSLDVIQRTFEHQGLEFAAFLEDSTQTKTIRPIADYIDECLGESSIKASQRSLIKEAILYNLAGAFYASEESERLFFSRLSATYTLLFCLNTEPRIVGYFQDMAADFYLYVGSDLIVRALSERYLLEEDQHTRNIFRIIRAAGGRLVLSEPVLEEIHAHLIATDLEFINHYQGVEKGVSLEIARNIDRILIRAYFYAKLSSPEGVTAPASWAHFVNQFCDYTTARKPEGEEQIKKYLMAQFGMIFEDADELRKVTNAGAVSELAERLKEYKKQERLAENDALMALSVYGRRRKRKETSKISEFGYRTWWLTGESRILHYTEALELKEHAKYIMRPDFLVNFLALAPSAKEVRDAYRSIFPSILGIRLARRIKPEELSKVLDHLAEAEGLEPGRREAKIAQLSDQLKSEMYGIAKTHS
jgi:hypothetical protein